MTAERFEDEAVISGAGISQVGRRLGRADVDLAIEACARAVADAGLQLSDIDALVAWPGEHPAPPGFTGPGSHRMIDALGLTPTWHASVVEGSGQSAAIVTAMMAVASGYVRHALVYRATTEATGQYGGGRSGTHPWDAGGVPAQWQWLRPFGSVTAATWLAPLFQRYIHDHAIAREQLAWLPVVSRENARRRGTAIYDEPLTVEGYLEARMIATPFSLYDCDVPADGAAAFVVSAGDYAPDAPNPVRVEAVGTATESRMYWDQWLEPTAMPMRDAARQLWTRTSLTVADVDVAQLYDGFSFLTYSWLEAFGFCGRGEAPAFLDGGKRTTIDGELPLNTAGGQMNHGRLHSYGLLYEACMQLRGHAGPGQVDGAEVAAVGAGGGPLGGAWLLTSWR